MVQLTSRDIDRFWSKVAVIPFHDCWEWAAGKHTRGYGVFRVGDTVFRATRIAYYLYHGEMPQDLVVRHKCDNPSCVREEHLELGTQIDNIRDRDSRGRWVNHWELR